MPFCGNSTIWDWQRTRNSSWPELPVCFQETALIYLPAIFLWLASPPYWIYLARKRSYDFSPCTWLSACKTALSLLLALLATAATIKDFLAAPFRPIDLSAGSANEFLEESSAHYLARSIIIVNSIYVAILIQIERSKAVITSGVLVIYWLLSALCGIIPLYSMIAMEVIEVDRFRFAYVIAAYCLTLAIFLLHFPSDIKLLEPQIYSHEGVCPEVTASFLSKLTFLWISKIIFSGYNKSIQVDQLWPLNPRDKGVKVQARFFSIWNRKQQKKRNLGQIMENNKSSKIVPWKDKSANTCSDINESTPLLSGEAQLKSHESLEVHGFKRKNSSQKSLFRALVRAFGNKVILSYVHKFFSDTLQFSLPFLLRELIVFIENRDTRPMWQGFVLAAAMCMTSWLQTVLYHQHFQLAMTTGMRMRSALMGAIYQKSLLLDPTVRENYSVGELTNLISVDCQRIQDMLSYTWMIWSIPYQMGLAVYLLWGTLGAPMLAGLILLLLLVPVNGAMAVIQQRLQRANLEWKDRRIRMLSEVISGIKVLKLYAWENAFLGKILNIRRKELVILTRLAWVNAFGIFVWTCAPYSVCLVSFGAFVVLSPGRVLTPDKAFVTLSLFNILQFPIAFIPEMVNFASQAHVSLKRIQAFLCEQEMSKGREDALSDSSNSTNTKNDVAIHLSKASFQWDMSTSFRLNGISLNIPKGNLVAIVGPVCSGKSSLLSAILGEMKLNQGSVSVDGSTAYVPQESWLQNTSVKENILFGSPYHSRKYRKVIESCAMSADLLMLPDGDDTQVGDKGITLSGGQKQRINIARAVYADTDVYLLDDPLSAVDLHVGKHIFKRVLSNKGSLKHKTRVFTTQAVHWLPLVDHVLFMQDGCLVEHGSYQYLMGRDGPLTQFLFSSLKAGEDDNETASKEDPEIAEIKRRMLEHVETVTSHSDATTSGDDSKYRHHKFHNMRRHGGSFSSSSMSYDLGGNSEGNERKRRIYCQQDKDKKLSVLVERSESELVNEGNIQLGVYTSYCKHIGIFCTLIILITFACYQACNVLANIWLSKWTSDIGTMSINATSSSIESDNRTYLTIYASFGVGQVLFIFIYACIASLRMVAAASVMHASMLRSVLGAPMRFFDATPVGRILNRFSRDVETLDNNLPQILFMWIMCVFSVLATLIVVTTETPIFVVVIAPLFAVYWGIQRFFVPTSRQLKRQEAITRSPVFSYFSETLTGSHVIRAYHRQDHFIMTFTSLLDKNIVAYFAGITANRWLGVWIEVVSSFVVLATSLFSITNPSINGATLGLSVTYALQITQALKWLVRTMSDIETNAVSVERVREFSLLPQEAPYQTRLNVPQEWPDKGKITIDRLVVQYRQNLPPVLKDFSCAIEAGEKIAIVGRTGAGKSSLTLALFRILEASQGTIHIDGINTAEIGLETLRSRLTILPQDPVILSGSLRMNLDPKGQYRDDELWTALTLAHLKDASFVTAAGLDSDVGENGSRMSMGQRQLMCLARALLRRSQILLMDEPTSCMDLDTDCLVQQTVMDYFRQSTVLTIAHRVQSVLNYDRVMVLHAGSIEEFDSPLNLLKNPNSLFAKLCKDAGFKPQAKDIDQTEEKNTAEQ